MLPNKERNEINLCQPNPARAADGPGWSSYASSGNGSVHYTMWKAGEFKIHLHGDDNPYIQL